MKHGAARAMNFRAVLCIFFSFNFKSFFRFTEQYMNFLIKQDTVHTETEACLHGMKTGELGNGPCSNQN